MAKPSIQLPVIGWREWVRLPDLGVPWIKAKIDTGARTSSLHAFDVRVFRRKGREMVAFQLHPLQRDASRTVAAEAELVEFRRVRSSGGHETSRPVILVAVELLHRVWTVELTLASRDAMGFRMLLGRQALRGMFVVDASRSFIGGKPVRRNRRRKRSRSLS